MRVYFLLILLVIPNILFANNDYKFKKQPVKINGEVLNYLHLDFKRNKNINNIYFVFVDGNEDSPLEMLMALKLKEYVMERNSEMVVFFSEGENWDISKPNYEVDKINKIYNYFDINFFKNFRKKEDIESINKFFLGYGSGATVMNQFLCKYNIKFKKAISVNGGLLHNKCNLKNINGEYIAFVSEKNEKWENISTLKVDSFKDKVINERKCEDLDGVKKSDFESNGIKTTKLEFTSCEKDTILIYADTEKHFFPGNDYPYWNNSKYLGYSAVNILDILNESGRILW